jgi:ABC-type branched-subunit amino acid transport system substrate-binding protein
MLKGINKKEIIVAKAGLKTIEANLSKYEENYILVPNADQAFAITLFKQLEEYKNNYAITLLVHPKWIDFQTIEPALLQKYKVIVTTAYFVDYNLPKVSNFVKKFRDAYYTEPQEMAFKGFDQAMYLLPMLKNIKAQNPLPQYEGLASKFNLQNQNGLGLKNSAIHILQYCENDLFPIK